MTETQAEREVELAQEARTRPRRGPTTRALQFVSRGSVSVFLIVVGLLWLIPAFGLLIASLRPAAANNVSGWWTVFTQPTQLTLRNYRSLLDRPEMVDSFWNTVFITLPATAGLVVLAALAAYAFAWMDFRGRDVLFLLVVGLLVVPLQVALIPVAQLFNVLGIFGTIPGVVLFHIAFGLPFGIFLLRNFFAGIPRDLLEAARMDGASEWMIFSRVVLPLGLPAIASLAIFQFLWVWNDLLVGLVFAGSVMNTVFQNESTISGRSSSDR
jgi:alpha-glucoside transport system permease protein